MSLVKSTPINVDETGGDRLKQGFLSQETWFVYVCHSKGEWAKQNIQVPLNGVW
jgi:hypothetical protein